MAILKRLINWISDLRFAIFLLLMIALGSTLGTLIPQKASPSTYLSTYEAKPWLGLIGGKMILRLQLDHVYTSHWFIALLILLGIALMACSWRRQWPTLKAALRWIDYQEPSQLSKLSIAQTISLNSKEQGLSQLSNHLKTHGWAIQQHQNRFAARQGVIGRLGPPLVHIGLVLLMIGAIWSATGGQKVERFLAPGRSFDLLNNNGLNQLTITLKKFAIDRDPAGRPEQFRSKIQLSTPNDTQGHLHEISVNHPFRYKGMTIYQADWSVAAITLQIGNSPQLQLPVSSFPELGEQIWGLVIPTQPDGSKPVFLSTSSELGPVQIFNSDGELLTSLRPGNKTKQINGIEMKIINIIPASGLLLKRDPGVPIVYSAFGTILVGGVLSMIATKQIWAIIDRDQSCIHLGGLCNRNMIGFINEIPNLLQVIESK